MHSVTIMRDECASRQSREGGGAWVTGDSRGISPSAAARAHATAINSRGIRCGVARQTVHSGDPHSLRIDTEFVPARVNPGQMAAGEVSRLRIAARGPNLGARDEKSPGRCTAYAEGGAPLLPLGRREQESSPCSNEGTSPALVEEPKLRDCGSDGYGILNSVGGGLSSRRAGQVR